MSADILGTSCDQCRSMVQYSFTSTETSRLVRTDSPGRPPRLSHSSWTMTPSLSQGCQLFPFSVPGLSIIPLFYHRAVNYSPFLSQGCQLFPFSVPGLSIIPLFCPRAVNYYPFLSQGCQSITGLSFIPLLYHRAVIYSLFLSPFSFFCLFLLLFLSCDFSVC